MLRINLAAKVVGVKIFHIRLPVPNRFILLPFKTWVTPGKALTISTEYAINDFPVNTDWIRKCP